MNGLLEKALYALLAIVIVSCATTAPMLPSAEAVQWTTYTNEKMAFSIDVPNDFNVQEYDGDIFFRYKDHMALRITFTTDLDSATRGLWGANLPVAQVTAANLPARKYIYDHYDGPVFDHFVAYIFDHRSQSLALGFHNEQDELNSLQQRVLDSLKLQ